MRVLTPSSYEAGSRPSTLIEPLRRRGEEKSDRLAYRLLADAEEDKVSITYGELCRRAQAVAAHLQRSTRRVSVPCCSTGRTRLRRRLLRMPLCRSGRRSAYPPRLNRNLSRLEAIGSDAGATLSLTTGQLASRVNFYPNILPCWENCDGDDGRASA